jgi:hypothetical protein
MLPSAGADVGHKGSRFAGEHVMSKADEFRQYADEAMGWIDNCSDPKERLVLISLANTWLRAAGRGNGPALIRELPPKSEAA